MSLRKLFSKRPTINESDQDAVLAYAGVLTCIAENLSGLARQHPDIETQRLTRATCKALGTLADGLREAWE